MDADSVVFLNGRFLPRTAASLDIEERAAMFADGVYEVVRYYGSKPLAMREHAERLQRSMTEIAIEPTSDTQRIEDLSNELVRRNRLTEAKLYWQVSRGAAPRDHAYPKSTQPTVLLIASSAEPIDPAAPPRVIKTILANDERWHRCDIKSVMLLPNVLARNRAIQAGCYEAILHRGDRVTEGTCASLFIARGGEFWTHPADHWILGGITRSIILKLLKKHNLTCRERTYSVNELLTADEVFMCGSTTHVAAVSQIDSTVIGNGSAGPLTTRIHQLFMNHIVESCLRVPILA